MTEVPQGEVRGVSFRARFDRGPSGVRGALILRGVDAVPHLVRFRGVAAVALDGAASRPVTLPSPVLDVAPHRDVFVPIEVPTADLAPGWYAFRCDAEVDGVATEVDADRRFLVGWPRGAVRRGTLSLERSLALAGGPLRLDAVEFLADSIRVPFAGDPALEIAGATIHADDEALPILGIERDATGKGRFVAYPVATERSVLRIGVGATSIDVPLG